MKSYWISRGFVGDRMALLESVRGWCATILGRWQADPASSTLQCFGQSGKTQFMRQLPPLRFRPWAASTTQAAPVKPKDSYMLVELSKPLKAKKLKIGDKVTAEVIQDVIAHAKVIIPVETKLVGHVTEVNARDKGQLESRLGIVFDRILLKHYHDIGFEAVVQAVSQPVMKKSRVDEPSQMLPPSMLGGGARTTTTVAAGRGNTTSNRNASGPGGTSSSSGTAFQIPVTVKESPSTNTNAPGALLEIVSNGKPMSVGMPLGVFGIKGLGLSSEPSPLTPGPVILSNTQDVKLDSGTQILLRVLKVEVQENAKSAK